MPVEPLFIALQFNRYGPHVTRNELFFIEKLWSRTAIFYSVFPTFRFNAELYYFVTEICKNQRVEAHKNTTFCFSLPPRRWFFHVPVLFVSRTKKKIIFFYSGKTEKRVKRSAFACTHIFPCTK